LEKKSSIVSCSYEIKVQESNTIPDFCISSKLERLSIPATENKRTKQNISMAKADSRS